MLAAMTIAGLLTSNVLTKAAIQNTAASTALFMGSFLSPHLQELARGDALSPEKMAALDRLFRVGLGRTMHSRSGSPTSRYGRMED